MAHYTAAVISKDLKDAEKLLERHCINNIDSEIIYSREELIKRGRREQEEFNKYFYSKYLIDKDKFKEKYKYYPEFINYVENIFPEQYKCNDEFLYNNIIQRIGASKIGCEGQVYMECNLDGKYARYSLEENNQHIYAFQNNDGSIRMDCRGLVKDLVINRKADRDERKALKEHWNRIVERNLEYNSSMPIDDETRKVEEAYHKQRDNEKRYFIDTYGDFENFLKYMTTVHTFAVVTPDGIWHENALRNSLGQITYSLYDEKEWIDNYYERFLKMYSEYYITFITFSEY